MARLLHVVHRNLSVDDRRQSVTATMGIIGSGRESLSSSCFEPLLLLHGSWAKFMQPQPARVVDKCPLPSFKRRSAAFHVQQSGSSMGVLFGPTFLRLVIHLSHRIQHTGSVHVVFSPLTIDMNVCNL